MVTTADIFNRPPAISEDTLQYVLYPLPGMTDRASVTTLATVMQSYAESLLPDFLWHRDPFELKVVADPEGDGWLLEGRMRVGDSVDDEWCVVWLLREISKKWDAVISVFDSDGEFLLIEAAEVLPSWVTPTNSENRVWIYNSHLHLIPLSHISAPSSKRHRRDYPRVRDDDDQVDEAEDDFINPSDAVKLVRDPSVPTTASPEVEETVWKRISGYPAAARQHVHVANAWLPVDIAKALAVSPALVQKPIETFYTRDAIQLRAAQRMSRFPPESSVLRPVKMTRTAYAQLIGQKFHPPKVFGRWREQEGTKEWRWRDIGMKIACGFEMLYQESKRKTDTMTSAEALNASAEARKEALRRNPEYVKYMENLASSGYFKGEQQGSQLWNELETKAADAFIAARREDDATRPSFAEIVSSAISQAREDDVQSAAGSEDSDDWLNIDAASFDDMLQNVAGGDSKPDQSQGDAMQIDQTESGELEEERIARKQAEKLEQLAKKVGEFVEGQGDLSGARFAEYDQELSDEHFSISDDESDNERDETSEEAKAARQAAMDKLVPGIDPSEYGQMPASYHSNSQRVAKTTIETDAVEERPANAPDSVRKPIRPPILPRNEYEGVVDSDDESDEGEDQEEEEEDRPQLVGDVEINMDEEEEEFIEFARQALGLSDEQWRDIIQDRKDRGAFIPASARNGNKSVPKTSTTGLSSSLPVGEDHSRQARSTKPGGNPNLDSFEAVMQAMDAELASKKSGGVPKPAKPDKGKGKAKGQDTALEDGMDIEEAMDAELRAAMERGEEEGEEGAEGEESIDYNLIKNFLESFKSQGGLSGPVSNLAGRLQQGWTMPRDEQ
ncbi:SGT1-domain-containing protein [Gloeophyllum trabeum ATCC 11539]|uniref:SGT1-domain-containing protein n=1 Tax=Gloeophyllum trabeum (strain ATCC 11539 / FP-39264 / Madison 617) TaxID=670483 RepID=S7QNA4_GLOTA|nr:SGT1-domain-containing protein [Gloeophyllum trabeum ATCC 11539]EPQ60986.1 SGT1-domain-containing protein [Gloeophyllum trabeum ATCC 11539]